MRLDVRRLGTLSLGAVGVAAALAGSASPMRMPAPSPTPSPTPSVDGNMITGSPIGDLADFRAVQREPAASAPIRRLPKVRLATVSVSGIPPLPLAAYHRAARREAVADAGCHLPWWLLAGIGFVESGHARSGGSERAGWRGIADPPIYGPILDGHHGYKAIADTDNGALDGDKRWDRAVGPMQFLPTTWRKWAPAGHFDGSANPQDIVAASSAAASYLCASGSDLSQPHAMALAVYSYNHSFRYVRLVLSVAARYAGMTPDQLGVNLLPKDKPAKAHRHRHTHRKNQSRQKGARGSQRVSGTPSPSPSPSPSASPSASSSPQPIPNPLPTLSPIGLH